jgi:hypothetical protein
VYRRGIEIVLSGTQYWSIYDRLMGCVGWMGSFVSKYVCAFISSRDRDRDYLNLDFKFGQNF